jgi:hypothetical protein
MKSVKTHFLQFCVIDLKCCDAIIIYLDKVDMTFTLYFYLPPYPSPCPRLPRGPAFGWVRRYADDIKPHLTIDHDRGRIHIFKNVGRYSVLTCGLGFRANDRWQQQDDNEQQEGSESAYNRVRKPAKTTDWLSWFTIA